MHNRRRPTAFVAFLAILCLATPATAASGDLAIGLKGGLNWSLLQKPTDPVDSPTLMHGTAFDGVGGTVGASFDLGITSLAGGPLALEVDALYSRHVGHGFEKHDQTGARRDVTLKTDVLRVPALAKWQLPGTRASPVFIALGPELWAGLRSGAKVSHNDKISAPPQPLQTTPVQHLAFTGMLGFEITAGSDIAIPIELRTTWDPFVPPSTAKRFDGYESYSNPGEYEVAFDLQVIAMSGITWTGL